MNDEECQLLIVADGVSTAPKDRLASQSVIKFIREYLQSHQLPVADLIIGAVQDANYQLIRGVDTTMGMLTTLSLLVYQPSSNKIYWVNVGDSRIYRYKDSNWEQITVDDSASQPYMDNGRMRLRNGVPIMVSALTRAIGASAHLEVQVMEADAAGYAGFLLCTDGFYGLAGFGSIATTIYEAPELETEVEKQKNSIVSEITDDASLALIRFHYTAPVKLHELISGGGGKLPPAFILTEALETELTNAIRQNNDLYIGQLLSFMEDKNLTLSRPKMITLLESMIRQKSRHLEVMKRMSRRL